MDVTNFVTASEASSQAFKTATLLKSLTINALIMGENGVGKRTLASFILPNATAINGSNYEELLQAMESSNEIIITDIDNFPNIKLLIDTIKTNKVRVVATSKQSFSNEHLDDIFSVKFDIPPLSSREEDVQELIEVFVKDAVKLFGGENKFDIKDFKPDLSDNANSLRRQVMISYLLQDIDDKELMDIIENYLFDKLGSNSDYRNYLYLYEVPLIRAGLTKFKSQLQLSDRLGLNRNTLRKKISDNKEYLQGENNE
ncbi:Fis family transcriptional regulator [Sulfurimonas marina]|uniref:Fis family transcriptional regulator n=1 Tax=Sulfurimonas marina TaxID=2590551 RepID=A0A7M1AY40_9BACT|nr:Fis family transcriptional regulator [Sulfurimonas marina]QOP42360.1 Fis family transcriptional regulator [Sulfurimonas marina]